MSHQILPQNPALNNSAPTAPAIGQPNAAFLSNESNHNRIDLPTFLVKRIVAFGRLSMGGALKAAMVNPILRSSEGER